jgi:hypothetical protein
MLHTFWMVAVGVLAAVCHAITHTSWSWCRCFPFWHCLCFCAVTHTIVFFILQRNTEFTMFLLIVDLWLLVFWISVIRWSVLLPLRPSYTSFSPHRKLSFISSSTPIFLKLMIKLDKPLVGLALVKCWNWFSQIAPYSQIPIFSSIIFPDFFRY